YRPSPARTRTILRACRSPESASSPDRSSPDAIESVASATLRPLTAAGECQRSSGSCRIPRDSWSALRARTAAARGAARLSTWKYAAALRAASRPQAAHASARTDTAAAASALDSCATVEALGQPLRQALLRFGGERPAGLVRDVEHVLGALADRHDLRVVDVDLFGHEDFRD